MKDELKNLRTTLNQTVFKDNHFTEANKDIVRSQIHRHKEKPYHTLKRMIHLVKPKLISAIGTMGLFVVLIVLIINVMEENGFNQEENNSSINPEEIPNTPNNLDPEEKDVFELPESVIEQIAIQLGKMEYLVTIEDVSHIQSLHIGESFDYLTIISRIELLKELSVFIPVDDWSFLNELSHLKDLKISNNHLQDLALLPHDFKIHSLSLYDNHLNSLEGIENLSELTFLDIRENEIVDLSPIQNLTNLTSLYIHDNEITSIEPLQNLTKLEFLSLDANPIQDFSVLENLTNLESLSLAGTDVDSLDFLRTHQKLVSLILEGTNVSDLSVLADKENLSYLDIRNTKVTSIQPLIGLYNLKVLLLDKDQVTDWTLLEGKEGLQINEHIGLDRIDSEDNTHSF